MRKIRLLATLPVGALVAATLMAPSQAETFGPSPTVLKEAEVHVVGTTGRGNSATLGSKTYFAAFTAASGTELWVTDGTPAGTKMLRDIQPGSDGSEPESFAVLGGKVYFAATTQFEGRELWQTDGTAGGTVHALDLNPGAANSNPTELVTSGGRLYFIATHPDYGREVWVSDGGSADAHVLEATLGTDGSLPQHLTRVDGGVAFSAVNLLGENRPFFSGGTPATTRYLDGGTAPILTEPGNFTALDSRIVFTAYRPGFGYELYRSDTRNGDAALVKELIPGGNSSDPQSLTVLGDEILFAAYSPTDGRELWTTNGTPTGTRLVRDILDGPDHSYPDQIVRHGDHAFFVANDGTHGQELWTTNGTPTGTRLVKDVNTGPAGSDVEQLRSTGHSLVFSAHDAVHGQEPWVSNGAAAGTRMTRDLNPGAGNGSYPDFVGTLGSTVVFGAQVLGRAQVMAYTTRASSTRAYPKSSYSRSDGAKKHIRVKVVVRASGTTPTGIVTLKKGSKTVGSARLYRGTVQVRITSRLGKGRHTLRAYYRGSINAQTSTYAFRVKVR